MTLTSPAAPAAVVEATEPPRRRRADKRVTPGRALTFTVLIVGLVVWILPFAWMLLGSVKTQREILQRPPTWWPQQFTWENFGAWFGQLNFGQFFGNSIVVALFTVAGNLVFCSMVGYALAKMDFPGKKALFVVVMVTLMVPGVVTFVPLFVMVSSLGLVDSYAALILPFVTTPLGVFLMRQFMLGIPDPLLEAARIDGAGELRIFARIVMPLCGPPLATLGILTFLASWNNFLWPLVAAQTEAKYTLPVALSLYSTGQSATDYGLLLAGSVLVIAPIILLFVFLQRYFIQGIASTGLK
ncbi:carbohydrate ABC transporter membrane protein 2 (CUT1 family) [Microbacterium sp. AG157]|uniref:Sugar ABC transporter permease n=1 Tax=Microbacterium testaceum TaxID=2033 RepID=A0A4Y3QPR8_MICTE|nr:MULTISPECIES: carbohydrate ABC transporter permease [Microbacterium]PNW10384.1 sugar ABC transporter permease [Microbacterium testaceum]REC98655.1 carbohydrate ABC transporter membrane protein 2 (CUT1 family) [Microbacterium sp. AG157]WJS90240.1 carbohydrate ABC transporter permease [Microbacterium testaceum]GEB46428.1 sugar ABC transporter permease [Microbacterium testaceum]